MSTGAKIVVILGLIIILAMFGWWYFNGKSASDALPNDNASSTEVVEQAINPSPDIVSPTDTSDASLDADLSAIDAQMKNAEDDLSGVDTSLKNQAEPAIE